MDLKFVIDKLASNKEVFRNLFNGMVKEQINWKPAQNKWSILEIACHLVDEECEDFRQRIEYTILHQGEKWPAIDPVGWVKSRKYAKQDYKQVLDKFIAERQKSLQWLAKLKKVNWDNVYLHPQMGEMSARMLLFNWPAHDYFHIRQINRYNFEFLDQQTAESLKYAGTW